MLVDVADVALRLRVAIVLMLVLILLLVIRRLANLHLVVGTSLRSVLVKQVIDGIIRQRRKTLLLIPRLSPALVLVPQLLQPSLIGSNAFGHGALGGFVLILRHHLNHLAHLERFGVIFLEFQLRGGHVGFVLVPLPHSRFERFSLGGYALVAAIATAAGLDVVVWAVSPLFKVATVEHVWWVGCCQEWGKVLCGSWCLETDCWNGGIITDEHKAQSRMLKLSEPP